MLLSRQRIYWFAFWNVESADNTPSFYPKNSSLLKSHSLIANFIQCHEMIEIFGWIFFVAIPAASLFFLIVTSCYREVSGYFSMILYFCMWLYIIFEIPAEVCGLWYNSDLEKFRIAVYCMIPGFWLILFIEHYFCTEYEFLTNLGDVSDYANIVRNLRFSQPRITFHVNILFISLLKIFKRISFEF